VFGVVILPFILLSLIIADRGYGRRGSALLAAIVWGCALIFITEALSLFRALNFFGLSAAWLAASLALLFVYLRAGRKAGDEALRLAGWARTLVGGASPPTPLLMLVAAIALVIIAVGINALAAAPNSFDAMTYHMARVTHWIQNRSVEHYPTSALRQLYLNPWAEWAILHVQILSGGDRLANLVQWSSMIDSVAGVSLIAKQLGADVRGQILAAVAASTIPAGILQASGTQNDYVVAFWLICFVHCVLSLRTRPCLPYAFAAGASLGLALLTKGTAYIYAAPFLCWLAFDLYARLHRRAWTLYLAVGATALILNAGFYARNVGLFGSPLGVNRQGYIEGYKYSNDIFTVPALVSNVARNVSLHVGTPSARVNYYTEAAVYRLHGLLGLDPVDPRTTWMWISAPRFQIFPPRTNEYLAGNPLHLALILFSIAAAFKWRGQGERRDRLFYLAAVAFGFLIFCAYLRWQPWHARLHLPLFLLCSPLIAVALTSIPYRRLVNLIAVGLLVSALPYVLCNKERPLIASRLLHTTDSVFVRQRIDHYFFFNPPIKDSYFGAANFLSSQDCASVGLLIGHDDFEYPLWALFRAHGRRGVRIEHVGVNNASAEKYKEPPFDTFEPCAIFVRKPGLAAETGVNGRLFRRAFEAGDTQVFLK